MPYVSVDLDGDLHVKVSKFANGIGMELGEVISKALVFALRSRYPDNELPEGPAFPDNSLPERPVDPGFGNRPPVDPDFGKPEGGRPDQGLPDGGGQIDNSLPGGGICPVFKPEDEIDNELPEGEIPVVDNELPETAEPKE